MKILLCVLTLFLCSTAIYSQNKPTAKQPSKFPQFDGSKPRIEMPQALKLMRKFIRKQKIDTSQYYLSRVSLIQYSTVTDKQIVWYFRWVKTDGAVGDYIEIAVFMDGSVKRLPPMYD